MPLETNHRGKENYNPEEKEKRGNVTPLFERDDDLDDLEKWLGLTYQTESLSAESIISVLFTPVQLKRLAVILSEQDQKGKLPNLQKKLKRFFGKRVSWVPETVSLESAVETKFSGMFGKAEENTEAVNVYMVALREVIAAAPEKAKAFFAQTERYHKAYVEAENSHSLGIVGTMLTELKLFFQFNMSFPFPVSLFREFAEDAKQGPLLGPRAKKEDYLFSYELHELVGKLQGLSTKLRTTTSNSEKQRVKQELKEALKIHLRKVITNWYV